MSGQAIFPRRGYENSDIFGIILHVHRHRDGQTCSEILISDIDDVPAGFGGITFINQLADTERSDFKVHQSYGAELESRASIVTRWSDDHFTLSFVGDCEAVMAPVKNQAFDYYRQRETYEDRVRLSASFTLNWRPFRPDTMD